MIELIVNREKNMNSSFVCISILVKSRIPKNCLINYLNEVSSQSLRSYLRLANIYDGNSNKKKSDWIEMIIYECMNGKLRNMDVSDISNNKSHSILPRYGNLGLKEKDLKPYVENEKSSIKLMNQKVLFD